MDGEVFEGVPSENATEHCYNDMKLLPLKARKYFVGMGREYVDRVSPVNSVCGACILFTTLAGKVGKILELSYMHNNLSIQKFTNIFSTDFRRR